MTHSTLPAQPSAGPSRPVRELRLLAVLCLGLLGGSLLLAEGSNAKVSFKDPSKPGRLRVYVTQGDLRIKAGDTPGEISVTSSAERSDSQESRSDGMRVLSTSAAGFTLTANENVAELNHGKHAWPLKGGSASFDVTVPRNTSLDIENGWGGTVKVEKSSGDIVIKGMNCEIDLSELSGGASIETMNGPIKASFASLAPDKPVSVSSMNGEVTLGVPADSKANVRFRTHNGEVLTNFPAEILKTTSENLGDANWAVVGEHIKYGAQIAREMGKEIAEATREMAEEIRDQAKEIAEEHREAMKELSEEMKSASKQERGTHKRPSIRPPKPPRPPSIPAISGGKVVSGSLNGGGTEISITTMNGDITLRKKE